MNDRSMENGANPKARQVASRGKAQLYKEMSSQDRHLKAQLGTIFTDL